MFALHIRHGTKAKRIVSTRRRFTIAIGKSGFPRTIAIATSRRKVQPTAG
jgi:hypothetical protein